MASPLQLLGVSTGLLAALALSIGAAPPGQTPSRAQPVFPSGIDLVTVDVVVLDREGNPIEGLTAADFVVTEDGRPQTVTAFQAVTLSDSPSVSRPRVRVSTNLPPTDSAARWFFVVFDDVNLSPLSTPRAREAVAQFLEFALRPGDQVTLVPSSGGAWWTGRLPEDRAALVAFVDRLQGQRRPDSTPARIWDHEAMAIALGRDRQALAQVARRYFENNLIPEAYPMDRELSKALDVSPGIPLIQARAREVYREATERLRVSLGALERLAEALTLVPGRKTVLLVSEGFILDTSQGEFRRLVQAARHANAAIHFVDARGPEGMLGQPGMAGGAAEYFAAVEERDTTTALAFAAREADGARSVALDTGGTTVAGTDLIRGLVQVAREARAYYLLGYTSTNRKKDGGFRRIGVSIARPDVTVRARGGYYAPSDAETRRPPTDGLDPAVRAALDAPFGAAGIPLRLVSYTLGPQADGTAQVLLLAEADLTSVPLAPKDGGLHAAFDSYLVVNGLESGEAQTDERRLDVDLPAGVANEVRRQGLPIRRELSLPPGRYQARFLLRDRASRRLGSVRHEFDVPALDTFRTTTPIVTDTVQGNVPGQPARPVPVARRTFEAGSRLYCAFDVLGAGRDEAAGTSRVSVGYGLTSADGTEVVGSPPRPLAAGPQGQLSVTIAFAIPSDARGPHDLRLVVRDEVTGRQLEVDEPIVVAPAASPATGRGGPGWR